MLDWAAADELLHSSNGVRGLLRRREIWLPTRRGLLLLIALTMGLMAAFVFGIYPFLALNTPRPSGVLIIEGWADDETLDHAVQLFRSGGYSAVYTTGQEIERSSPRAHYGSYANYAASRLHDLGVPETIPVPAPDTIRDRTYTSALTLRNWMREHDRVPSDLTVVSQGPHARRSLMLFRRAFRKEAHCGVVSLPSRGYDSRRWWQSSQGFREVIGETIAYLYVRLVFWQVRG